MKANYMNINQPGGLFMTVGKENQPFRMKLATITTAVALAFSTGVHAADDKGSSVEGSSFNFGGYARAYLGWNTDNPREIGGNDRGRLAMERGQLYLEADGKVSNFQWKLAGRFAREARTSYLKDLQDLTRTRVGFGNNPGFDVTDIYNSTDIREAWVQFQPTDKINVKFGRQQVVWGETDIFQALDVIHGYNFTWAPLLEEPDETRKPLILLNTTLSFPSLDGSLQFVFRPGWDNEDNLGSTWDLFGGRSRVVGYKGYSTTYGAETDWKHPEGKNKDKSYALRWKGMMGGIGYHLSYVNSFYTRNPIANSVFAPYKKNPVDNGNGGVYNLIVPTVQVFGTGLNGYMQSIDTVLSGELVYTRDEPFNRGVIPGGAVATACLGGVASLPDASAFSGFCGVKPKNTLMTMARAEKTFRTEEVLGTSGLTSVSLQLFNTHIMDFKRSDELVQAAGFPDRVKENTSIGTMVVRAPWMGDKLWTTVALGREFTNKGTFAAIAADYEAGTHWRLRAEWDIFDGQNSMTNGGLLGPNMPMGSAKGTSGLLDRNDRFYLRTTYQF